MKPTRMKFFRDSLIAALFFIAGIIIPGLFSTNPLPWQLILGISAGLLWVLRVKDDFLSPIETMQKLISGEFEMLGDNPPSELPENWRARTPNRAVESLKILLDRYRNSFVTQEQVLTSLKEMNRTHNIMLELSNSVLRMEDTDALFQTILSKAIEVVPSVKHGTLMVLNPQMKMEFKAVQGFDPRLYTITLDPKETFQWRVAEGYLKEPIVIKDIQQFGREFMDNDTYNSMTEIKALDLQTTLCAPITINGEFYGSINIDSPLKDAFTEQDLTLMNYFANQAGIVIKNHMLLEKTLILSRIDTLTGIYNRSHFDILFEDFLIKSKRYPEKCSVILMDVDGLKKINDTWGHLAGDQMLKHFASELKKTVRDSDIFARYGGDEFILVFFNSTPEQTKQRMNDIIHTLTLSPLSFENTELSIAFSYGMAQFPDEAKEYKTLVHLADERMYTQKVQNRTAQKEKNSPLQDESQRS